VPVVKLWRDRAKWPDKVEVVIAVDGWDGDSAGQAALVPRATVVAQHERPGTCVKGWNLAAEKATGDVILAIADDFIPPACWDEKLAEVGDPGWEKLDHVVKVWDGYNPDLCTLSILTKARYDRLGYVFYPGYLSLFCTIADTSIYMADQSFCDLGGLHVGDEVVGTTRDVSLDPRKNLSPKIRRRLRLRPSRVISVHKRKARTVRVEFESGDVVWCTPDHLWGCYDGQRDPIWRIPEVGRRVIKAVTEPDFCPDGSDRELGWLAGIFDGEGCFPSIAQSSVANPMIFKEIKRLLEKFNFKYSNFGDGQYDTGFRILGGREEFIRFLNWVRPLKRKSDQVDQRVWTSRFRAPDKIVSVEESGIKTVVSLKTETGDYIAGNHLCHNCDTEFTEHALRDRVMVDAMHLFFEHIHPDCGKRERDMADSTHASSIRWTLGESLYHYRKSMGFPIDLGPRATRPRPAFKGELNGYAVYMQAIKDDFCMWEVCYRMMEEGVRRFFIFVPDHYWSGEPNPHEQALDLIYDLADKVRGLGGDVDVVYSPVDFKAGKNRLEVETDYRNKSLAYMWDHGVEHALVVDSDELWDHGMLEKIMPYVAESPAIQVTMVPVIGLPGYPVDGASDSAVVYVKKGNKFSMCRTPVERAVSLAFRGVVHFTGTRRSHEEIIKKMREGGHYDDPDYDFEGWIQRKLPNIKPGMKDAHMYRPYQIWPAVRDWTADEIERNMPPSIRPYLGLPVPMPERKNPSLVDMARFLNRPPCHKPTHSYYRVNVFGSPR